MNIEQYEIDQLKNSLNIIDIIGQYVELKKQGQNHFACCPFHGEKTPSFSVDEKNQFYHCFGCGVSGDVIKFVVEYESVDFVNAYKKLGGVTDQMDLNTLKKNINRSKLITRYNLPDSHKENKRHCQNAISKCQHNNVFGLDRYQFQQDKAYPIINVDNEVINMMLFKYGEEKRFLADGMSYNGFTPIKINDTNNYVACVRLNDGMRISSEYKVNVAVCWHELVMKYMCIWNNGPLKIKPAISERDDDYLCYEMDWIKIIPGDIQKSIKLKNMECLI